MVEFTDGINLLIGKNGSGKSSILEAIGLAMFGASTRTGRLQDAVSIGKKRGSIEIEFEGNDGIVYVLKRGIGNTSASELYQKDMPASTLSGIKEIGGKIGELCGIESSNIYDNVVTAGQNQIVGIFTKNTVASRKGQRPEIEEVFNKIFDTEIYREMYSKFTQRSLEKYKLGIEKLAGEKELVQENMIDIDEIKAGIASHEVELKGNREKLKEIQKEIESKEAKLEEGRKLKNELALLEKEVENLEKNLQSKKNELVELAENVAAAQESAKLCRENLPMHEAYLEHRGKLSPLEEKMRRFESVRDSKLELEKKIGACEKAISGLGADIKIAQKGIEDDAKNLSEDRVSLEKKSENYEKLCLEKRAVSEELGKLKIFKVEFEGELSKLKEKQEERKGVATTIKILEEDLGRYNLDSIEEEKKVIDKSIAELEKRLSEKTDLKNEKIKLESLLESNAVAREKLSDSFCPYFKDKCQNLANSKQDPIEFFDNRESDLKKKLDSIKIKLVGYDGIEEEEQGLKSEKKRLHEKSGDLVKQYDILKSKDGELASLEKLMEKISESAPVKGESFDETFRQVEIRENLLKQQEGAFKLSELESELRQLGGKIEERENGIESKQAELKQKQEELDKVSAEKLELEGRQKELSKDLTGMDELKSEIQIVKSGMTVYESGHNIYIQNLDMSKKLSEFQKKQNTLEKTIEDESKALDQSRESYGEKSISFDEGVYKKTAEGIEELRAVEKGIHKQLGETESALEELKRKKAKHKEDSKRLKQIAQEVSKLNKKISLADKFRGNLNSMGKMVADKWIKNIALKATENFREVTGRPERIEWINNDRESFAVYLSDGEEFKRKFTVLSGGEQVAVALSIRAAMATLMSDADFSIFDEPTNNLDMERKLALADSMDKILRGCRQNIIVTHDDTFREMAQNIIELDKI